MSVSIKYKGAEIASASTETTKTIKTAGKYCEADILVENTPDGGDAPVINPLSVTENGTYTAPSGVDGYSPVTVNVPQGITPTGNINITDTNVTDVTNYATAQVVDADLVAENIKKDVNILGVVGSFEGGGGSLPSVISKIDGGSFTVSADTICNAYDISHNLGVVPKGFTVWTEEEGTYQATLAAIVTMTALIDDVQTSASATAYATSVWRYRAANGTMANANSDATSASAVSDFATSTKICAYRAGINYRAGNVYKWLAWV